MNPQLGKTRRQWLLEGLVLASFRPILVSVNVMFDQGIHSGKGLSPAEITNFDAFSGAGAYLRKQGYSDIPSQFLLRKMIKVFVTMSLCYDMAPAAYAHAAAGSVLQNFHRIERRARARTLPQEYAHHFTLDTRRNSSWAGNFWADARNDYVLCRQRNGYPVMDSCDIFSRTCFAWLSP